MTKLAAFPLDARELSRDTVRRFRERFVVGPRDECWLWVGSCQRGLPIVETGDGWLSALRVAFALGREAIPGGVRVRPCVRSHRCVNPMHLTLTEGVPRRSARSNEDVVRLVLRGKALGFEQRRLAALLGIAESTVSQLLHGKTRSALVARLRATDGTQETIRR